MGRPKKNIEVPGQAEPVQELETATPEPEPEELQPVVEQQAEPVQEQPEPDPEAMKNLEARNAALSELPANGLALLQKFEALGFENADGQPLTDNLEFIALVKRVTTSQHDASSRAVQNEDGQRVRRAAPVLTDKGWRVEG